ncbi:hypothetical protein L2K70_01080 [Nocardioides KLBMP 9356]|uniref:Glycosyltransferase family 4 protein n=1 Tax=Nocardioides potassii TaxID=2911371 RepID=A0ABS9H4N8_9ACTN|nr:hypothetical protein [Nocardioides potassii]MCF6376192.1 hypothetical protein [Nocardioides potassii]
MRIVLANSAFHEVGGSQTYLLTLGENLVRLGHDVRIYARTAGDMARSAAQQGITTVDRLEDLGEPADAVVTQDGVVAHDLAHAWPGVPQAFVCHSSLFDFQQPPLVPGIATAVIVLNDRVRRRVEALNADVRVVRLTQPIDTQRFSPLSAPHAPPRRALVLSSYLDGAPRQALEDAWGAHGVELVSLGIDDVDLAPELRMNDVDVVVGKGRVVLEAMACGRPAYLFDSFGGDGWVTPETYPAIEADGFTGQTGGTGLDVARMAADIAAYDPEWGRLGRELVLRQHDARMHAQSVLEVLSSIGAGPGRPPTLELELSRQIGRRWAAEAELFGLRAMARRVNDRADAAEAEAVEARRSAWEAADLLRAAEAELDNLRARVDDYQQRNRRLRRKVRRLGGAGEPGGEDD